MQVIFRVIYESLRQAAQQLSGNKLRTLLSLLGITIGIFCIIGVQSATNSLQDNVMGSLKKLGDDVIYVQKMSWTEDPGQNWWKYQRRPDPSYDDLKAIQKKVKSAGYADYHIFVGMRTAKFRSNSVEGAWMVAVTYDFDQIFNVEYDRGRWYTPSEYHYAMNRVVIGY
ncbi:MAG: ABC transporter permease, partial [Bacteroidota bacterium]